MLTAMTAERSCERLIVGLAQLIDAGAVDRATDLFTEDAEWRGDGWAWQGRGSIRDGLAALAARWPGVRHHVASVAVFPGDGSTAAGGLAYVAVFVAGSTEPALVGEFRDRLTLTHAGWRIDERHLHVTARRPGVDLYV
jgi:hypothetical protein